MSFADLQKSNYTRKKEVFSITVGEGSEAKEISFTAYELSTFQQVEVEGLRQGGGEWLTKFIVYSVKDSDGKSMTAAQAANLPPEYAAKFLDAVLKVNPFSEAKDENNKKK